MRDDLELDWTDCTIYYEQSPVSLGHSHLNSLNETVLSSPISVGFVICL